MMLTKRIIPCLDVQDGSVVKGISFRQLKTMGDPVEMGAFYAQEGADELVFLDISASYEGRKTMVEVVRRLAANIFIPLTVGGGITDLEDIKKLLRAGADKVSLNTAAVQRPDIIKEAASQFGRQCIVVAIDAKSCGDGAEGSTPSKKWQVYTHGGRQNSGLDVMEWAQKAAELGAGEILLTSMDQDGRQNGYDLKLIKAVSQAVNIPIIASGGAGTAAHLLSALQEGADAVLAASILHQGTCSIKQIKEYLQQHQIAVRL